MSDRHTSQGEAAYDQLMAAIRAGTYHPCDCPREVEVADRLALSRTSVREALRRLEADGIVERHPRLGAVIRQLSHNRLVELHGMRTVRERTAAEMAAKHAAPAKVAAPADAQRIRVVTDRHQDILDAIAAGDAARAGNAAALHLQTSLRHRLKVLRD
ncbi:MAG: GntR family transcriptional regulator [Pseudomonadota bacterium]